jgi:hypothetical protein
MWASLCVSCFIMGLPCMTQFGYFILDILDVHGGAFPLLFLAMMQTIAVSYIYGVNNFSKLVKARLGLQISTYWKVLWIVSPVFLGILFLVTIVCSIVTADPMTHLQGYHYPAWSRHFGWALSIVPIIIFFISGCFVILHRFKHFNSDSLSFKKRLRMALVWSLQPGKHLNLESFKSNLPHQLGELQNPCILEGVQNFGYTSSSDIPSNCSSNSTPQAPSSCIQLPCVIEDHGLQSKHEETMYNIPIRGQLPSDAYDSSSVCQKNLGHLGDLTCDVGEVTLVFV